MNIKDSLIEFVTTELLEADDAVSPDENLLADGMVDSLGMLRLLAFIESSFSIKVPPTDFVVSNFRTINILSEYLAKSSAAHASSSGEQSG